MSDQEARIAVLEIQVEQLKKDRDEIKENYVTKARYLPTEKISYGVIVAVVSAIGILLEKTM